METNSILNHHNSIGQTVHDLWIEISMKPLFITVCESEYPKSNFREMPVDFMIYRFIIFGTNVMKLETAFLDIGFNFTAHE